MRIRTIYTVPVTEGSSITDNDNVAIQDNDGQDIQENPSSE